MNPFMAVLEIASREYKLFLLVVDIEMFDYLHVEVFRD